MFGIKYRNQSLSNQWCRTILNYFLGQIRGVMRLQTIPVHCSRLDTVKELINFIALETFTALSSSFVIVGAWMTTYLTEMPSVLPFLISVMVLAFVARRWYQCDLIPASNHFLFKLRLAKLLCSCFCTLICLLTFLFISIQPFTLKTDKESNSFTKLVSSVQIFSVFHTASPATSTDGTVLIYGAQFLSTIFLISLESVLLTDITSNVMQMTRSKEFRIALINEAPIILYAALRIGLGTWIFNILNSRHQNGKLEIILLILMLLWVWAVLLDVGVYRRDNDTPRSLDFDGYKMMQDICWYQVDVNIVAYSVIILIYSQWKTAISLFQKETNSVPERFPLFSDIKQSILSIFITQLTHGLRHERSDIGYAFIPFEGANLHSCVQLNCETFFFILMAMISVRFKRNFESSYKFSKVLRTTRWQGQFGHHISSRELHSRIAYSRETPFQLLWAQENDGNIE